MSKREEIQNDQQLAWAMLKAEQAQELTACRARHKAEKDAIRARHKNENLALQEAHRQQWVSYRTAPLGSAEMTPEEFAALAIKLGYKLR